MNPSQLFEKLQKEHDEFLDVLIDAANMSERDNLHKWYLDENILSMIKDRKQKIKDIIYKNEQSDFLQTILSIYLDDISDEVEFYNLQQQQHLGSSLNTFKGFYFDLYISMQKFGYK